MTLRVYMMPTEARLSRLKTRAFWLVPRGLLGRTRKRVHPVKRFNVVIPKDDAGIEV